MAACLLLGYYENATNVTPGRPRSVNEFHVALVHLVKRAYPTSSAREVINYVQEQTGDELSESDVSRALKDYNPFETLSLKKIAYSTWRKTCCLCAGRGARS
jgi:transposase